MKPAVRTVAWLLASLLTIGAARGQGPLNPSAAPEPTMKSLQELWDELQAQRALLNDAYYLINRIDSSVAQMSRQQTYALASSLQVPVATNRNATHPSMVMDETDRPYVAFGDFDGIWIAHEPGSQGIESVDPASGARNPSVALKGKLGISYSVPGQSEVRYATPHTLGGWTVTAVDSGSFFDGSSLAYDSQTNPAVSYADLSAHTVKYAGWNGSSWVIHQVDSNAYYTHTSLTFAPNGTPAIAYYDDAAGDLRYAGWNGNWVRYNVDTNGHVGATPSLAFDGTDPVISYIDVSNGDLKFARWTGSVWATETVDATGNVGVWSSLKIAPDGHPAIAYQETILGNVRYAKWNGGGWDIQTVALSSSGDANGTSLAFTSSGQPGICFSTGDGVKYVLLQSP
jgi:hypothetical protein